MNPFTAFNSREPDDEDEDEECSIHSQVDLLPHQMHPPQQCTPPRSLQYHHLKERLEPSSGLFHEQLMSRTTTCGYLLLMGYFFFLLIFRFIYLRIINSHNDVVTLLMVNILAQMGVELCSKVYLVYGDETATLFYKQCQFVVGWKSIYLFVALALSCVLTIKGTVSDFPHKYQHINLIQMAAWRSSLSLFCFVLSNDNTYLAHLYYENFFHKTIGESQGVRLTAYVDKCENTLNNIPSSDIQVVGKSSQEEILKRVKLLMPTFILLSKIMKVKSVFNVLNTAVFFILSLGVIGHSENNGMFYYNVFMIVLMSTISYTSFETISMYNNILDMLDTALENEVKLHLHVRVSSYAVDDRFLTITAGAAFLQVVLKTFGIS
jgi:hypothetical protein